VPRRRNKYGAVPTIVDGIRFASKLEAARYAQLRQMQSVGLIRNLELQPRFPCVVNSVKVCDYVADFAYFRDNTRVIEDVKGVQTDVFKLKWKLVEALYHVRIEIVKRRR
jgi:Protein of unknown function (DUF1064)